MSRTQLTDGSGWFDRDKATLFEERTYWDGRNHISCASGSQWDHERLYRTASGAWVLHTYSQWQGSGESYGRISDREAYTWLDRHGHDDEVPADFLAAREV